MGGFGEIRRPEYIEKQREAEKQRERQRQEVRRLQQQANVEAWSNTQAAYDWFARLFDERLDQYIERDRPEVMAAFAEFVVEQDRQVCKRYEAKIAALDVRIKTMEQQASIDQRFFDLEHRLDARPLARDEAKRGSEIIPQGDLLINFEKLQRQVDDLERVADLDARFRDLAERVGELEKTNSLEARLAKLANEAKGPEVPQSELLAKIERLQRQADDLKRAADLDTRDLAERVGELENTNSLEARFTKLANEVKGSPDVPQGEFLGRIEKLQCQIDDCKVVAAQPGPQGPPGPPGKLPRIKEYIPERVHYEAEVVVQAGALWQASSDTVHAPPHSDWICIARAGRDGCDG